ncbi:hypothetical protein ACVXHB_02480 [Escherichia coli]
MPPTVIANLGRFQPCHADINEERALAALDMRYRLNLDRVDGLPFAGGHGLFIACQRPGAARLSPNVRHRSSGE